MPTIEFVGQSSRDPDARMTNSGRLVNWYREPIIGGGQAAFVLKSVLGMNATLANPDTLCRALHKLGSTLYAVSGDELYSITTAGAATNAGTVSVGADCSIAANDGKITVAGNGNYYVWDGSSLTQPSATRLTSFNSLCFLGDYTILTGPNTNSGRNDEFQWSDLTDPTTLDALNFNTADGTEGDLVRCFAVNGLLWLFKDRSHEVWQLTGQSGANAFSRLGQTIRDVGLKSYRLIGEMADGAFFVDQNNRVRIINGIETVPVSIPAVETSIKQSDPESCFYYSDEGHRFIVVRFTDRPAWVFDVDVGEWHERAEGTSFGAWSATCSEFFDGSWQLGTQSGPIKTLSRSNADGATPMRRTAISRTLYMEDRRFNVSEMQFRGSYGTSDIDRDAKMFIRVSRDNGLTFGEYKEKTIGDLGDYGSRCIFRRMGTGRSFAVEMNISDPADIEVLAEARVEVA